MANTLRLIEHLNSRPIAPIFARLNENEKNDEIALKFMCVVDYEMTKKGIYDHINSTNFPKLMHELLGFNSYKSFRYFEYTSNQHFNGKYLQCQSSPCQFIGPYMLTLTHMAINHNAHYGVKWCLYCKNANELRTHITNNSLQECFENYLHQEQISDIITELNSVNDVISDFYAILKEFSKNLDIHTQRKLYCYMGKVYNQKETLDGDYGGDIEPEVAVRATKVSLKPIPTEKLNQVYDSVIVQFYGGSASRFYSGDGSHERLEIESSEYFAPDEQQPGTSNSESSRMRIGRVFSMHDRPEADSRAYTSMSMESNVDPFIQYLGTQYDNIDSKKKKKRAQLALLEVIQKFDDEENH